MAEPRTKAVASWCAIAILGISCVAMMVYLVTLATDPHYFPTPFGTLTITMPWQDVAVSLLAIPCGILLGALVGRLTVRHTREYCRPKWRST